MVNRLCPSGHFLQIPLGHGLRAVRSRGAYGHPHATRPHTDLWSVLRGQRRVRWESYGGGGSAKNRFFSRTRILVGVKARFQFLPLQLCVGLSAAPGAAILP
jgi:hypothetical protein